MSMTKSEKWLLAFKVIYDALKYVIDHLKEWTKGSKQSK